MPLGETARAPRQPVVARQLTTIMCCGTFRSSSPAGTLPPNGRSSVCSESDGFDVVVTRECFETLFFAGFRTVVFLPFLPVTVTFFVEATCTVLRRKR